MEKKLEKATNKEFVLTQTEVFDNSTKRLIVPSDAITIVLSDNDEVCFLFDIEGEVVPCGVLEQAYVLLLHLLHTTVDEAKEKFRERNEEAEKIFNDRHPIFNGWINSLFKKYMPDELLLIIRQGVINGVCLPNVIPADLTFVLKEFLRYGEITHYYIGAYEQVFIIEKDGVPWQLLYSDVNKFPPTLFKNVSFEGDKMNYDMIYSYEKDGEVKLHFPAFLREHLEKKIKRKGKKKFKNI